MVLRFFGRALLLTYFAAVVCDLFINPKPYAELVLALTVKLNTLAGSALIPKDLVATNIESIVLGLAGTIALFSLLALIGGRCSSCILGLSFLGYIFLANSDLILQAAAQKKLPTHDKLLPILKNLAIVGGLLLSTAKVETKVVEDSKTGPTTAKSKRE